MKVLRSIGNAFVKIWRWIKNTAWVQPLLIVGLIFGVIFSIPAITKGIQSLIANSNAANKFYEGYQLSLEGGSTSKADNFINNFVTCFEACNSGKDATEAVNKLPENERRCFLYFVSSTNASAKEAKDGFEVLRDGWTGDYAPSTGGNFQLYTIYSDESTSETTKTKSAFTQFIDRNNSFLEKIADRGKYTNYCINKHVSESEIETFGDCNVDTFKIPTLMYIEWIDGNGYINKNGIKEIVFTITGNNKYDKARFLYNCWNSKKEFDINA